MAWRRPSDPSLAANKPRSGCERSEKRPSVCAADQGVDQVFWMRHQTQHIEPVVEHARYRIDGAVGARVVPHPAPSILLMVSSSAMKFPSPCAMANLTTCPGA